MKHFLNVIKYIYKSHKLWFWLWIGLNLVLYIIFSQYFLLSDSNNKLIPITCFALMFYSLVVALSEWFGVKKAHALIRQFPVTEFVSVVLPLVIVFLYGTFLYIGFYSHFREAFYTNGFPSLVYIFFAPYLCYGIMRLIQNSSIGSAVSGCFLILIILISNYIEFALLNYWELEIHTVIISLTILTVVFLENQNRRYVLPLIGLLVTFLTAISFYQFNYRPKSLQGAAYELSYYPSKEAIKNLKELALNKKLWKHREIKICDGTRVNRGTYPSKYIREFFNVEEQIQFLQNVLEFSDNFECYWSDESDEVQGSYPIRIEDMIYAKEIQRFLIDNWKDQSVFCSLMPNMQLLVESKSYLEGKCGRIFLYKYFAFYNPVRNSLFDKSFDDFLLSAHKLKSHEAKDSASSLFIQSAKWKYKNDKFSGSWLERESLSLKELNAWKKDFKKEIRDNINSWSNLSKNDYKKEIAKMTNDNGYGLNNQLEYFWAQIYPNKLDPSLKDKRSLENFMKDVKYGASMDYYYWLTSDYAWEKFQKMKGTF